MHDHEHRAGIGKIEIVAILVVIGILIALFLPALHKMRHGADSLKDKTAITQIHKSMLTYAEANAGLYPTPGLIRPIRSESGESQNFSLNHSASLYSYMVGANLVGPNALVSIMENETAAVYVKDDYNFNAYNPAAGSFWDSTFRVRIDSRKNGANCSYAHAAICGDRREVQWRTRDTQGSP